MNTGNAAGRAIGRLLDLVLPPQCLACGDLVASHGVLCPACWETVTFLTPPQCAICGIPFPFEMEPGTICAACARQRPPYGRARAAMTYAETSRKLLIAFKHADRTDATAAYGRWLLRAGAELLDDADLVVPVPLHWTRLLARRYNQAALLAQKVAGAAGLPFAPRLLRRRRRTASQGHMSPTQRRTNVQGAFIVTEKARSSFAGKRVLLVDDVMTTGATAEACARALTRAGAAGVDVLTLARVVLETPDPSL